MQCTFLKDKKEQPTHSATPFALPPYYKFSQPIILPYYTLSAYYAALLYSPNLLRCPIILSQPIMLPYYTLPTYYVSPYYYSLPIIHSRLVCSASHSHLLRLHLLLSLGRLTHFLRPTSYTFPDNAPFVLSPYMKKLVLLLPWHILLPPNFTYLRFTPLRYTS